MIRRPLLTALAALAALALPACSLQRDAPEEAPGNTLAGTAARTPDPATLDAPDVGAIRVDDAVLRSGRSLTDWPATGFNIAGQRFSPLDQLTPDSVRSLSVAWSQPLVGEGDAILSDPFATPVVSGQVLYATGGGGWVHAYDVRTGEVIWRSDETRAAVDAVADQVTGDRPVLPPAGLALWKGRVFVARPGGELASIDAKTGRTLWSHRVAGEDARITSAPLVAGNLVYLGVAIGEPGAERGAVVALDYSEGRERWRFFTVPSNAAEPDEAASDDALGQVRSTWAVTRPNPRPTTAGATPPDAIGGGLVRTLGYDAERERLLVGTGRAMGEQVRAGTVGVGVASDRLFTRSLLALAGDTGAFAWHRLLPGTSGVNRPLILARLPGASSTAALVMTDAGDQAIVALDDGALLGWRPLAVAAGGGQPRAGMPSLALADAAYSPDAGSWLMPGLPTGPAGARLPGLVALDPATGQRRWAVRQASAGGGLLATAGGLVFQGSADGRLTAFAVADGRPVWAAPFGGPLTVAPSSFLVAGRQTIAAVVNASGGAPARLVLLRGAGATGVAATQQNP